MLYSSCSLELAAYLVDRLSGKVVSPVRNSEEHERERKQDPGHAVEDVGAGFLEEPQFGHDGEPDDQTQGLGRRGWGALGRFRRRRPLRAYDVSLRDVLFSASASSKLPGLYNRNSSTSQFL